MSKPICVITFDETPVYETPPGSVDLHGSALLDGAEAPVKSWLWTLLAYPSGIEEPTFLDDAAQDTSLTGISAAGDYLVMLTCELEDGTKSETSLYLAPDSALQAIQVKTANSGLIIPAEGERGWASALQDALTYLDAHKIEEHANTAATGAQLDELVSGSRTLLHEHDQSSKIVLTLQNIEAQTQKWQLLAYLGTVDSDHKVEINQITMAVGNVGEEDDAFVELDFYLMSASQATGTDSPLIPAGAKSLFGTTVDIQAVGGKSGISTAGIMQFQPAAGQEYLAVSVEHAGTNARDLIITVDITRSRVVST